MSYFYFITNEEQEQGIIKLPCPCLCCLELYLMVAAKEEMNILSVDFLEAPVENTGHVGHFIENRIGKEIQWTVKFIGSPSGKYDLITS